MPFDGSEIRPTTWDGATTLELMGIFTISTGERRISEPSTVCRLFWQNFFKRQAVKLSYKDLNPPVGWMIFVPPSLSTKTQTFRG